MNTSNNFKALTTDIYGYLDMEAGKHYQLINAHSLRDAGLIWLKRVLKMPENEPVYLADGKFSVKTTLQNWVNGYGETVFENMDEPTTCTVVSVDEALDRLINAYGFLTVNKRSIEHSLFNEILNSIAADWQTKDYELIKA